MVFQAFQGQMACRECQACLGRRDHREEKVQKDKLVIRDRKECRVQEETEGARGLPGRAERQELWEQKVKFFSFDFSRKKKQLSSSLFARNMLR